MEAALAAVVARVETLEGTSNSLLGFVRGEAPAMRQEHNAAKEALSGLLAKMEGISGVQKGLAAELQKVKDVLQTAVTRAESLEKEVKDLEFKAVESAGRSERGRGVDAKNLVPDKYKPSLTDSMVWRNWSYRARSYLSKAVDPTLAALLKPVETRKEIISSTQATELGMTPFFDRELRAFLNACTDGDAFSTVKGAEAESALEIWRQLADQGDPVSEGRQMNDLQELLDWPRCDKVEKLRTYAQDWEEAVLGYEGRSGEKFPTSYWRVGLLKILPLKLFDELKHVKHHFPTYSSLKSHVRTLVVERGFGQKMGVHSFEEKEEEREAQDNSDGMNMELLAAELNMNPEELMTMVRRTQGWRPKGGGKGGGGKGPSPKGGGKGGASAADTRECYACGRLGHIRIYCRATLHKNGGPIKPKGGGKGGGGEGSGNDASRPLGSCEAQTGYEYDDMGELCFLEEISEEVREEMLQIVAEFGVGEDDETVNEQCCLCPGTEWNEHGGICDQHGMCDRSSGGEKAEETIEEPHELNTCEDPWQTQANDPWKLCVSRKHPTVSNNRSALLSNPTATRNSYQALADQSDNDESPITTTPGNTFEELRAMIGRLTTYPEESTWTESSSETRIALTSTRSTAIPPVSSMPLPTRLCPPTKAGLKARLEPPDVAAGPPDRLEKVSPAGAQVYGVPSAPVDSRSIGGREVHQEEEGQVVASTSDSSNACRASKFRSSRRRRALIANARRQGARRCLGGIPRGSRRRGGASGLTMQHLRNCLAVVWYATLQQLGSWVCSRLEAEVKEISTMSTDGALHELMGVFEDGGGKEAQKRFEEDIWGTDDDEDDLDEPMDLCPLDDLLQIEVPEKYGLVEGPRATLDSGATNSVANARIHFPGASVLPSDASRRGVVYQGPGKETIPNRGEFTEQAMTAEGIVVGTTWQDAEVRKPLMAVSACADKGNMTIFDQESSCILSAKSEEIAEIRRLIKQAKKKVVVHRVGGTYSFRMWRVPKKVIEGFRGLVKR